MRYKVGLFCVMLLALWQAGSRSGLVSIFSKHFLETEDYLLFVRDVKILFILIGLLLLLSCFFIHRKTDESNATSGHAWIGSFVLALGLCTTLTLIVNPDGRLPWHERKDYVTLPAHSIKTNLYNKIKKTPDLLVFGSSISFTTPTNYFKQTWHVNAFNMSFNGGGPVDFLRSLNYVIQKSPDGKIPSAIVVEIVAPSLEVNNLNETPIQLWPYIPTNRIPEAVGATLDTFIRGNFFIDSIFTSSIIDANRWLPWIAFAKDGTGLIQGEEIKRPDKYQLSVKDDLYMGIGLISCKNKQLDPLGKEYLKDFISLARANNIGMVFYRPPINDDLYVLSGTKARRYHNCRDLFNNYMQTLVQQNPNISYRDLSDHPKISKMGRQVYIDTHHLNSHGNRLILKVLNKEITAALNWARTPRQP